MPSTMLTLASATLSAGVQISDASGGDPQRITPIDRFITTNGTGTSGLGNNYNTMFWDPDGVHLWTVDNGLKNIWKVNADTGVVAAGPFVPPLGANAFCLARTSTGFWVSTQTTKMYKYDFSGVLQTTITLESAAARVAIPDGQETRAWVGSLHNMVSAIREVSLVTGLNTTRVLPGGAIHVGPACGPGAAAPYLYTISNTLSVNRYLDSDITQVTTRALNVTDLPDEPDSDSSSHVLRGAPVPDPLDGNCYVWHGSPNNGQVMGMTAEKVDFSLPVATSFTRALWPGREMPRGLDMLFADAGSATPQAFIALSIDGLRVAQMKRASVSPQTNRHIYVYYRDGMSAQWSYQFEDAVTLDLIAVPGQLANERGTSPMTGETLDFRRTRCSYSLNGGGAWTSFTSGSPNLDQAITAGQTILVKVEFEPWMTPGCPNPYVGGDAGEGITLVWDDGLTAKRPATKFNAGFN
jgi:hypothetical protein